MTPEEQNEARRRQKSRAVVMAVLLLAFAALVYAISIAKMGMYGG
jgi:accessory gene regulator protein AgrB